MANQMTPDEMRGRAHSLRVAADKAEEHGLHVGDLEMRAFIGSVRAGADALDRLADGQTAIDDHMRKIAHRVMDVFENAEEDTLADEIMQDVFTAIGLTEAFGAEVRDVS